MVSDGRILCIYSFKKKLINFNFLSATHIILAILKNFWARVSAVWGNFSTSLRCSNKTLHTSLTMYPTVDLEVIHDHQCFCRNHLFLGNARTPDSFALVRQSWLFHMQVLVLSRWSGTAWEIQCFFWILRLIHLHKKVQRCRLTMTSMQMLILTLIFFINRRVVQNKYILILFFTATWEHVTFVKWTSFLI